MTGAAIAIHGATSHSPWANELIVERLKALWLGHSASQISNIIGAEFNISVTRNAIIGKAVRLGINQQTKTTRHNMQAGRPRAKPRATLRVVSGGSGGALRVTRSVSTDLPKLRCIAEPSLNLPLLEWTSNTCKYIAGDDGLACGHKTYAATSWCLSHFQLIRQDVRPVKRTAYTTWGEGR